MKKTFLIILILLLILVYFTNCSSAPKNPGDVYYTRKQAEVGLDNGNKEAGRGNFENALMLITECKRLAIICDDMSLIIRCSIARANVLFALERIDDAFAEWDDAVKEAQKLNNAELLAASKIYRARGALIAERQSASVILDEITREQANLKNDRSYIAFSHQARGLALRALGRYTEAENALKQSLAIHEKARYLENAAFDWYTIASVRSLAGNTSGAIQALESAMAIDRRIENGWGLAASWRAMGDVLQKADRAEEAQAAYERAERIHRAMSYKL